uniref:hypothetical protein n=1 Tax=Sphingomonas bacterium TaxID=1895847 RepID=UPI00262D7B17|nr:hypothetical protein [Sphingomonas bacterium]
MGDQMSLAEALIDPRLGTNAKLERLDKLIEWQRLVPFSGGCSLGRDRSAALCAVVDAEGAVSSGFV